jgi:hypothetical protein
MAWLINKEETSLYVGEKQNFKETDIHCFYHTCLRKKKKKEQVRSTRIYMAS